MKKNYSNIIYSNLIKFLPFIFLYLFSQIYFNYKSDRWMLDDGMIIATMVRNFQDHTILTHHLSDKLGTATSPLFALIAGIISKITLSPILSLKFSGAFFLMMIAFYAFSISNRYAKYPYSILPSALILLFPHNVAYSQAGLPTFFYAFFVFLCLLYLFEGHYSYSILFATFSLITRPDGILLFLIIIFVLYNDKKLSKTNFIFLIYGATLYFFYLLCHFLYYDSFLPHSIFAKSIVHSFGSWSVKYNLVKYLTRMFIEKWYMNPFYIVSIIGFIRLFKQNNRFSIFILWWLLYHILYFVRFPLYSWYLVPPMPILMFFSGFGFIDIFNKITENKKLKKFFLYSTISVFFVSIIPYANHKQKLGYHNKIVLKAIGEWLNKNKEPNDAVMTESLGYIGYYSKMKVYDFPGLAVRDIPNLIKDDPVGIGSYDIIINNKNPKFLSLRFEEWNNLSNDTKSKYTLEKEFISPDNVSHNFLIAKSFID